MAIKAGRFLTFGDGVAEICGIVNIAEEGDRPKEKLIVKERLRFENRTVGLQRFFDAAQEKITVSRVISLPLIPAVSTQDVVVISGNQYEIKMKQEKFDTRPASMLLTLSDVEEIYEFE